MFSSLKCYSTRLLVLCSMWKRTTLNSPPPIVSLSLRHFFFFPRFAAISCLALPQKWSERPFLTTIKSTRLLRPPWALLLFPSSPPQSKKGCRVSSANGGWIATLGVVLLNCGWSLMDHPNLPATDAKRSGALPWLFFGMEGDGEGSLNNGKHFFSNPLEEITSSFFPRLFFLPIFDMLPIIPWATQMLLSQRTKNRNPDSVVFLQCFTLRKKGRKKTALLRELGYNHSWGWGWRGEEYN